MSGPATAMIRGGRAMARLSIVAVSLGMFITAVYGMVTLGIGELAGGSRLVWSIVATAVVAVAFEPARAIAQRLANRFVYGRRTTPYEVLVAITDKLASAEADEGLLERMASLLRGATGAARVAVWLTSREGFVTAATDPAGEALIVPSLDALPGAVELIDHDGDVLGALTVEKTRGDALSPPEAALMGDLAGSAALVVRRLRLTAELEATAQQLDESRRRLVTAHDVERRRLERELRDSVEPAVIDLQAAIEDTGRLAAREGPGQPATLLAALANETNQALVQIRTLAHGLNPPLLDTGGLAAAVPALAASSPLDVAVDTDMRTRHPVELEGAVYFCISEALTNAAKHGYGPISLRISDADDLLSFDLTDAGPGFDPHEASMGAGLKNMADRLEAHGGSINILSTPGSPTRVSGRLPVAATPASPPVSAPRSTPLPAGPH